MSITAIETEYAGVRFRSRLEAKWAMLFELLGVPWEYEPEGLATPAGNYLPDFRISAAGLTWWVEVKPTMPDRVDPRWPLDLVLLVGAPHHLGNAWYIESPRTRAEWPMDEPAYIQQGTYPARIVPHYGPAFDWREWHPISDKERQAYDVVRAHRFWDPT